MNADLSEWRVESVTNFRNMFMDTPQYSQQLCWNISIGARTDQMFNGTPAGFDKKCVIPEIYKESGSAAPPSWMAVPSTWAMMAGTGLVALLVGVKVVRSQRKQGGRREKGQGKRKK